MGATLLAPGFPDAPGVAELTDAQFRALIVAGGHGHELIRHVRDAHRDDVARKAARRLRPLIEARDGALCRRCRATGHLQVDHLTPLSCGGTNALDNLALLCPPCNRAKAARTWAEWLATTGA